MSSKAVPQIFERPLEKGGSVAAEMEKNAKAFNDATNPFSEESKQISKIPFYQTGARAFIKVGGRPIGVATDIRWQVSYQSAPIFTIDTPHPWDIDVGQASIGATLNQIFDPTKGPEADGLFHTMQSAVHQPLIELQVLDRVGTSLFFARGMFTSMSGSISRGQISTIGATFVGVAYQHYVSQFFKPYDSVAGNTTALVNGLKNLASKFTGGIL